MPSVASARSPFRLARYLKSFTHTQTHTRARARSSSSTSIVTLSQIQRTACAHDQFNGCSSTTNAHSEAGQIAVCCQILTLGALSSLIALSIPVGALFKKFGLFFLTSFICRLSLNLGTSSSCNPQDLSRYCFLYLLFFLRHRE